MSTSKTHRRGHEDKNRRGKLAEKSSSFHGKSLAPNGMAQLRRPNTVPDLLSVTTMAGFSPEARPRLTKLLLNVTIQRSAGAVQVVMTPESTVGDLIAAAVRQYAKEGRRPILPTTDPSGFGLHYSQFSLESLDREEKLMALGSRNFFLCLKEPAMDGVEATSSTTTCSKEAGKASKITVPWLKFMDFLL